MYTKHWFNEWDHTKSVSRLVDSVLPVNLAEVANLPFDLCPINWPRLPRFVNFGANLTQFGWQISHPWSTVPGCWHSSWGLNPAWNGNARRFTTRPWPNCSYQIGSIVWRLLTLIDSSRRTHNKDVIFGTKLVRLSQMEQIRNFFGSDFSTFWSVFFFRFVPFGPIWLTLEPILTYLL